MEAWPIRHNWSAATSGTARGWRKGWPGCCRAQRDLGLDFLLLYDADGQLVASSSGALPQHPAGLEGHARGPQRQGGYGHRHFSAEQLAQFDTALAERALTPFIATATPRPPARAAESRGMVIHAAAPFARRQRCRACVVVGGSLLNKNLDFVDGLNEIVYPKVPCPLAARARPPCSWTTCAWPPTCACSKVHAPSARGVAGGAPAVLGEGRTWLDSAFVVNDWYVSAYEPVLDGDGQRVGMLYVGYLENRFAA